MNRAVSSLLAVPLALSLAGALSSPAKADWLVTRDGARVETRGPWQVKGKLIVFQAADGKLASLRASEVDLEESRLATDDAVRAKEAAVAAAQKPTVPRKASVRSITDKDVRQVAAANPAAAAPAEKAADAAAPESAESPVSVASWERIETAGEGHIVIAGRVRNGSDDAAAELAVRVILYNEAGDIVGVTQAEVVDSVLAPGGETDFRASFPGVYAFSSLKFDVQTPLFETRAEPAASNTGT